MTSEVRDDDRLNDEQAQRVIARAAELDVKHGTSVTVAQLRAVALEVGLSAESFDAALRECAGADVSVGAAPRATPQRPSLVKRTLVPVGILVGSALVVLPILSSLGVGRAFGMVSAVPLSMAAYVAYRMRAPVARTLLVGYAIAIFADEYIHFRSGYPRLGEGSPEHWGIMIAAFASAAIATLASRSSSVGPSPMPHNRVTAFFREARRRVTRAARSLRGWEFRKRVVARTGAV